MDVPHVSLNMIVRDSAATIARAIESIKNFVDEIIVVDTGSTDNTVEIAKSLGAQVYFFEWINDYAAARNYAIEKSTGEWIISMDDDEYIDAENLKKLCSYTLSKDCYYIVNKLIEREKKFHSIKTNSARIFPNRPDIRWSSRVHETILESVERAGLTKQFLDVTIINDGFVPGQRKKNLFYKKLLEEELQTKPHDTHVLYHLAQECKALHLYEEAAKYYGECIMYLPDHELSTMREAIPNYVQMLIESGQLTKAVDALMIGREIFPKSPRLIDLHATIERFMGTKERAEQLWKELLEVSNSSEMENDMLHPVGTRIAALDRLAKLYVDEERFSEARECWNQVLTLNPENIEAKKGLEKINRTG